MGALWGVAAILLVAAMVVPAVTRPSTRLPPVAAADLIASIRQSKPGPLTGNVQFHEQLGLAGLSGLSHSPDGTLRRGYGPTGRAGIEFRCPPTAENGRS